MATFQKPASYSVAQAAGLPSSIMSYNPPRPPAANVRNVVVQNNTGNQTSAGRIEFQMPGGSLQYVKSGSMYIRGNLALTTTRTAGDWSFANNSASAAALINRLQVSIGGVVAERLDRYDLLHNALLFHTGGSYYTNDAPVLERGSAVGYNTSFDFCLPLMSQLFTNGQHFPLWACSNGSVVLSCDLNTLAEAIYDNGTGGAAPTNFTLSDCQLVYDVLEMSPEFIGQMRAEMAKGKAYSIPFLSFRNQVVADAATVSVNMALNCSSLKGLMFHARAAKTVAGQGLPEGGTVTSVKLFVDGQLINSLQQAKIVDQYAELQKFLSKLNDTGVAAGAAITQTTYNTQNFLGAVSTRLYDDAGYAFQGRPASNIVLEVVHTAKSSFFTWACFDTVLVIDPSGLPLVMQ